MAQSGVPPSLLARYGFPLRPRLIPTLVSAAAILVLLSLCGWQLQRHSVKAGAERRARVASALPALDLEGPLGELEPLIYRHVRIAGAFEGPAVLEGGRELRGAPAYAVLQSFRTDGDQRLLVLRGLIGPTEREAAVARLLARPARRVEGQLRPAEGLPEAAPVNEGADLLIWGRRGIAGVHRWMGELEPDVYLAAGLPLAEGESTPVEGGIGTGYIPVVERRDSLHYASQWFAIAGIVFGLWGWASLEKR